MISSYPDDIPTVTETRCQVGDLWVLGNHRLLCDDTGLKAELTDGL